MDGNRFTGGIPRELANLSKLEFLDLQGNQFTGWIPSELGNLSDLSMLYLQGNPLGGPIPRSFLELQNLHTLSVPHGVCVLQGTDFQAWLNDIVTIQSSPGRNSEYIRQCVRN